MNQRNILTGIFIIALIAVFSCSTVQAPGLGISPPSFTIDDALKGVEYEVIITVCNTGDDNETYELTSTGPASEWITYYRADEPEAQIASLYIPEHSTEQMLMKITVPTDAPNRKYTPTIYVKSVPPEGAVVEGAVAHAIVRIPVKGTIQVTGMQILKGTVKGITGTDTEVDYPLKIKVELQNEGNVVAIPSIQVSITKEGKTVDSFVYDEASVKPRKTEAITVLWNTEGNEPGNYTASVAVSLGDETLAKKDVPFSILPRGALTHKGVLNALTIEGQPLINSVLKIIASFENTGAIDTLAKFNGELYHDGTLIEVLESKEMLVVVGETRQLPAYYKITEPGKYTIKGDVSYEGKETDKKDVSFTVLEAEGVKDGEAQKGIPGFEIIYCLIALFVSALILCTMTRRRGTRKR